MHHNVIHKTEIITHNDTQRCLQEEWRTEPQPHLVKFDRVVFELREQTDRRTKVEKKTDSSHLQHFAPMSGLNAEAHLPCVLCADVRTRRPDEIVQFSAA